MAPPQPNPGGAFQDWSHMAGIASISNGGAAPSGMA
jgi:hypothetical protein